MKKLSLILVILFFYTINITKAQAPAIEWKNLIGGISNDCLYYVRQTADGGYILGGTSNSGMSGDKTEANKGRSDYWVIKLDGIGNIKWQKTIGGNSWDELYSIQQTIDGGYILGGDSRSEMSGDKTEANKGNSDYWVIKLSPDFYPSD